MSFRTMTDGEVVTSFRQAKDKREQIGILCDLNLCRKDDILNILAAAGEDVSEYISGVRRRKDPTKHKRWSSDDITILEEGCRSGGSCEELGASRQSVDGHIAKLKKEGRLTGGDSEKQKRKKKSIINEDFDKCFDEIPAEVPKEKQVDDVPSSAPDDGHVLGGMLDMVCRMVAAMKKEPRRVQMDIPGDDLSKLVMDFPECQIRVIM